MYTVFASYLASRQRLLGSLLVLFSINFIFPSVVQAAVVQQDAATAVVVVAALNVRSGPATSYAKLGIVKQGETLTVLAQSNNCAWLKVSTNQIAEGWVSGASKYVKLGVACSQVPAGDSPTVTNASQPAATQPSPTPTPAPTTSNSSSVADWLAPGADPGRAAELEIKVPIKPDVACVLFENQIGRQILITFTHREMNYSHDVRLEKGSQQVDCLPGGKYTFTISSPGYRSLNNEIKFYVGKRDIFTVYAN